VEAWGHGLVGFFNPQFLIQFVDATAETPTTVPDTGSTFGFLFVSLIAVFGLNRLRHVLSA